MTAASETDRAGCARAPARADAASPLRRNWKKRAGNLEARARRRRACTSHSTRSSVASRQPPYRPAHRHRAAPAPCRVRHNRRAGCSMSKCGTAVERHAHPVEHPARFHDRHVERLAVVGDERRRGVEELGDRVEQRALARHSWSAGTAGPGTRPVEPAAPDEKRDRAGAAAEPGGLEVDEERAVAGAPTDGVAATASDGSSSRRRPPILQLAVAHRHRPVQAIGLVASIDHQALAEVGRRRLVRPDVRRALEIDAGFVPRRCPARRSARGGLVRRPGVVRHVAANDRAKPGGEIHFSTRRSAPSAPGAAVQERTREAARRDLLGVRPGVAFGTDARRAAGLARTAVDQLARALEQQIRASRTADG